MSNSTTGQLWSRAAANYKWLVLLRGRGTERVTRRTLCLVSLLAALCALVGAAPSSGSGLADPPPVSAGLQLWYEADSLSDQNGAPVLTWPDGSGFGRDLSAFSAGQAPIMRRGAVNGKAALEFDGGSSLMKTYNSTFTIAQPDTFFVVYKSLDTNSSARAFVFDSRDSSVRQVFGKSGAGQARLYANQDLDYSGIAYPFDSYEVWSGTFNGSSSVLYRNGTSLGTGSAGGASLAGLSVGGLSTSGQYGYDLAHIQVAEILLYNGTMSAANRQALTDWLNQKYGLGGPPTPTAPSNTAPPTVTGLARENSTLTAATGTWSGTQPIGYAFKWQHCDANGAACTDIAGATSSTLTLGSTDIGFTVRAVVTATNTVGSQSASSQATAVVTQAPSGSATPPVTAGLQLWFDADSLPDADGAGVTTWPDGSGFGRDLSAFAAGQAPIMRRGAVNGRAALEFDGVSSLMKTYNSTFTIAQPDTFFVVYKSLESNPSGHEAYLWDSRDSSNRQLFGLGPFTNTEMYANIDVEIPTNYPFPDYQVWSGTFQGTSSTVWKNGTLVATGNTGTSNMSGLTVGALSTSAQYGYLYGHSLVAEILFYNGSMNASNRQNVTDWLKQKYGIGGTQTPVAPSNTALPTVTGQAIENSTLTATTGTWSGTQPIGYAFQWRRCDTTGNGCVDIPGATSNTLTLTSADVGSTIRAQVTATNSAGNQTASSQQTAVVSAAQTSVPPSNTSLPAVTGLARENSTLTATTGTWSGTQPIGYAFQWRRCDTTGNGCVDIPGATSNTLTLTSADVGSTIRAQVTATNSAGNQTASSQQTAVVSAAQTSVPPSNTSLPAVTGLARENSTLTATTGTWSGTQPIGYAFQWRRCDTTGNGCVDIPGATSNTLTLTSADVGSTIRAQVTATNSAGNQTASSQQTAVVSSAPSGSLPPVSTGLQLWYEADSLSDQNGAPVLTWPDGSGFGRDLSAFSAGQAPIMRRGAVNGKAALEFDGGSSLMKTYNSTFTIAQPDTFFVVYKSLDTNSSARAFVFDSRDSSVRQVFGKSGAGQARLYANQDLDYSGIAYPFDSYEVWSGTFNGSSSVLYRNGTSLGTGSAGGASLAGLSVGGLSTSGQYGYDLAHIQVAEILLYNGTMSAANRQALTDWLNQKYGLGGPPTPTAPSNTAPPTVTGLARENSTLTAATGTWSGTQPIGYAFKWQHCDANGAACTDIAGATSSTLTLGSTDIGFTVRAVVTATNTVGSQSASSQATAVVTQAPSGSATPPVTAGLQLWFDADSLPDTDGAGVTTWPDGSGFGRDLSAFAAGQAPIMRRGAVNGRAALEFDGASSLMKTYNSTFTIAQPDTFFVVYKSLESNPSGHEAYLWDSRDSSNRQLFGLGPFTNTEMYANIDVEIPTNYPFPDYQVWSGTFQGTSSTVWKNGTLVATGNTGTSNMSGLTVGALSTSAQYGYLYGHSLVAEILFYNGSMNASNRQNVTDWLKQKYGIG